MMERRFSEEDLFLLYASLLALQEVGQDYSADFAKHLSTTVVKGVLMQQIIGVNRTGIVKGGLVATLQKLGMKGLGGVIPVATVVAGVASAVAESYQDWVDAEDVARVLVNASLLPSSSELDEILLNAGWKKTRFCTRVMEVRTAARRSVRGRQSASAAKDLGVQAMSAAAQLGKNAPTWSIRDLLWTGKSTVAYLGKKAHAAADTSINDLLQMGKHWRNTSEGPKSEGPGASGPGSERRRILLDLLRDLEVRPRTDSEAVHLRSKL